MQKYMLWRTDRQYALWNREEDHPQTFRGAKTILIRPRQVNVHRELHPKLVTSGAPVKLWLANDRTIFNQLSRKDGDILQRDGGFTYWKVKGVSLLAPLLH